MRKVNNNGEFGKKIEFNGKVKIRSILVKKWESGCRFGGKSPRQNSPTLCQTFASSNRHPPSPNLSGGIDFSLPCCKSYLTLGDFSIQSLRVEADPPTLRAPLRAGEDRGGGGRDEGRSPGRSGGRVPSGSRELAPSCSTSAWYLACRLPSLGRPAPVDTFVHR